MYECVFSDPHSPPPYPGDWSVWTDKGLPCLVEAGWIQPMGTLVDVRTRVVYPLGSLPAFTTGWLHPSKYQRICQASSPQLSLLIPETTFFAPADPEVIKINTSSGALHNSL